MTDYGWLRDATEADLTPLVDAAWREINVPAGNAVAKKAIAYVMRAYRTPDLADPKAFVDAAAMALEEFPALVLAELASPKTGIVRESKFPPSIAELVQWCEARLAKHKTIAEAGSMRVYGLRRAAEQAQQRIEAAEQRRKQEAEWEAGAPERERRAKEAQALAVAALAKKAEEDKLRKREADARAAWTRGIFARFKDDASATERIFALTDEEQSEATKLELQTPGMGVDYLTKRIAA